MRNSAVVKLSETEVTTVMTSQKTHRAVLQCRALRITGKGQEEGVVSKIEIGNDSEEVLRNGAME